MSQTDEDVSVVICAYTEKRWDDLLAAIVSVQQQTVQPREIIVVIDHNPVLLKRAQERLVNAIVIENREAKGVSGSRNSGIAIAQGTIVAFLDDDAVAEPNWIEHLLMPYGDLGIIGVGGKINPIWTGKYPRWFPKEFYWVIGCTYQGMPSTMAPIRNMIGANMSFRRNTLIHVGSFRESFGCNHENSSRSANLFGFKWFQHSAGDEETELCIRAAYQQQDNAQFYYVPTALVHHRVPSQRTRWNYFLWRCYDEGIGKAFLVSLHGTKDGLASERSYTLKTLPLGVLRGLTDTLFHRDIIGLAHAGAILAGLSVTAAGYLVGRISSNKATNGDERVGMTKLDPVRA